MTSPENLVLEQLRFIRGDIAGLGDEFKEVRHRLVNLETSVVGLRHDIANLFDQVSGQHARYDRLAERIDRIEKQLNLTNGPMALGHPGPAAGETA